MASSKSLSACLISPELDGYNISSLPYPVIPVWTVLASLNAIAAPFTIIFNTLVIWAVMGNHQLRSKIYNNLLAALAVSDLLVGLVVEPLYCWYFVCLLNMCQIPCLFTVCAMMTAVCSGLTLCILTGISVERYFAIQLPFFHRLNFTTKRVAVVTISIFLISLPASVILRMVLNTFESLKNLPALRFIVGNCVVMLYCTARVYITAYIRKKAASMQPVQQEVEDRRKIQLDDFKRAFTMSMLVLVSILFYLPVIIINIVRTAKDNTTGDFKYIALFIGISMIHLQSIVNPLLLVGRNPKIRKSLKAKLMFCLTFSGM